MPRKLHPMCPQADLLKEIPLFKLLDDHERDELSTELEVVSYAQGASVFHVGDPGDAMFVIVSGEAEVFFKNDTGERVVLEEAGPGDFFGELAFLDGGTRNASVVATTAIEAFRLDREGLTKFLSRRPEAAMHLLAALSRRLRVTVDRLRHTASRNVNEELEDKRTLTQKAADAIASFAGSIPFLLIHAVIFATWLTVNTAHIPGIPQFDPNPFGLLTLIVSLEAIFLSVFVLLSQNRQAAKDRVHADIEYDVNLKAELEIAHLHEKVDRLNSEALSRLEKIQAALDASKES